MIIKGIELEDLDIFDADIMEKYEKSLNKVANKNYDTAKTMSESIKLQCKTVFAFFNDMWGKGTDKKVFGDKCNLKDCLEALDQVIEYVNSQGKEIQLLTSKYSPKRAERL